MLFNSYIFVFAFLPLTLIIFLLLGSASRQRLATAWLVAASLFFYGWWNPAYLSLIVPSMVVNFLLGLLLADGKRTQRRLLLGLGVAANLALLGYFKYANFAVDNLNLLLAQPIELSPIVLPLAISFFTFQQIAYLVDAYRGEIREVSFPNYCLFVTFFPQLIAGPIVHHKEMMPQFENGFARFRQSNLAVGLTIFTIGLFKKIVIADGIAEFSTPVFNAAAAGTPLTLLEAWFGALAYTFQLYFDFSGYSDMAIGLARLFGIRLPLNFFSPYKSRNIITFWRRWHITLSRFLRDYLYIPLGGNRKGHARRHLNLLATMLLGGLWHGAGWTFVIWGGLHGLYLVLNHLWQRLCGTHRFWARLLPRWAAYGLTFVAVVFAWVFFRADDLASALLISKAMLGLGASPPAIDAGLGLREQLFANELFRKPESVLNWFIVCGFITWLLPNTQQFMAAYRPVIELYRTRSVVRLKWRPTAGWAVIISLLALWALQSMNRISEFLYFRF